MADNKKISALDANGSPVLTDETVVVTDPSGTPVTQRVTLQALANLFRSDSPAFVATASATVANTVAETAALGSGVGSLTLSSGFLTVGRTLRLTAAGVISTTSTPNLTIKLKLGSTVTLSTGAVAMPADITNAMLRIEATLTCRATGGSGSVFAQGIIHVGTIIIPFIATAAVTVATNTSQAVGLTAEWGTADAANTLTVSVATLERLN